MARARVDLVLLEGERTVDVSFHPAASVEVVRAHSRRHGQDPNGWTGALAMIVAEDARTWGCWSGRSGDRPGGDLLRLLGGMTHPLVGAAYDAGAAAASEIPRWASPGLAAATLVGGAEHLFGTGRASRSVVRALASFLSRPSVAWWQLAVVVAASPVVEADDLVAALRIPVDESAMAAPPAGDDVRHARAGLGLLGPDRARRLVREAMVEPGGARRLFGVLRVLLDVHGDLRGPPPGRLDELEAVCLRAAAIDPGPPPRRAVPAARTPAAPAAVVVPTPPIAPPPTWTVARRAPVVGGPTPAAALEFRHGPTARALAGPTADRTIELVLPRTPSELTTWGRLLGNCLADFAPAVAAGATMVLGIRLRDVLVAAVEVREGGIVQLLGPRNHRAPARVSAAVVDHVGRALARPRSIGGSPTVSTRR